MRVAPMLPGQVLPSQMLTGVSVRVRALTAAVAVALSVGFGPVSAVAQDISDMADRIQKLERDLSVLQRQSGGNGIALPSGGGAAMGGDMASQLMLRLAEVERQMAELTGRMEETQHAVSRVNTRVDNISKDMDFRLQQLEQHGGAGAQAPAAPPAAAAPAPAASGGQPGVFGVLPQSAAPKAGAPVAAAPAAPSGLPSGSPEQQYNYASTLLRNGDYAGAQSALEAFVKQNPKHDLAGNAQYWLGETYYVRQDFKNAAVAFLDGYRNYPKNNKAPDNLLKLGLSMGALNQTKEACAALTRIPKEYPTASDVTKRRAESERDRLKCPKT